MEGPSIYLPGFLKRRFLKFEHILGTLLHELVHNSISRHGSHFRRKLEKVISRCEELIDSSIQLNALYDCGQAVGGDPRVILTHSQRELTRYAAESRLATFLSRTEPPHSRDQREFDIIELD